MIEMCLRCMLAMDCLSRHPHAVRTRVAPFVTFENILMEVTSIR